MFVVFLRLVGVALQSSLLGSELLQSQDHAGTRHDHLIRASCVYAPESKIGLMHRGRLDLRQDHVEADRGPLHEH